MVKCRSCLTCVSIIFKTPFWTTHLPWLQVMYVSVVPSCKAHSESDSAIVTYKRLHALCDSWRNNDAWGIGRSGDNSAVTLTEDTTREVVTGIGHLGVFISKILNGSPAKNWKEIVSLVVSNAFWSIQEADFFVWWVCEFSLIDIGLHWSLLSEVHRRHYYRCFCQNIIILMIERTSRK